MRLHQQPYGHLLLQPGSEGKDALLNENIATNNYGAGTNLWVQDASGSNDDNSLLQFDLGRIPFGATIVSARLELFQFLTATPGGTVGVHRVARDWDEGTNNGSPGTGASWTKATQTGNWATPGGDFDASPVSTTALGAGVTGYYGWDITPLVQGWVSGTYANDGLILSAAAPGTDVAFHSSDHGTETERPRLTVTYGCECGIACIAPQGTGKVVMIGNYIGPSPDPRDLEKEAIFESWGYDVDIFDDNFIWFINFSSYDVVYVSETVGSATVGNQLTGLSIGVINEEPKLYDDLEIASNHSELVGSEIDITDNSHFITAPFAQGLLPIYSADMEVLTVSGTVAPGLQTLAEFSGAGSLVVLEKHATVYVFDEGEIDGTTNVAGRRVTLPLGEQEDSNFNWDYLNNNGRLLVQRAIQWGTGNTSGAAPKKLLLVLVDTGSPTAQESAKQALFESWGYAVSLISQSDSQANFDAAVTVSDVVYITEDVASGTLGTKLVNAPIGVVTEEDNLSDEFGMSAGIAWETGTQVEINDNTHYITSPFPTGLLTILTSAESMAYVTGAQSPDLGKLASSVSGFNVVTLDAGAATYSGGFAAGRRVQLPWGNNNFDLNHLNTDGRTLLQRALEWGAGASLAAPQTILFVVPDATALTAQDAAKKTLMEAWGYSVALITAADTQANFDAAVAGADVAYISEEALSSDTGTKLRDATIGVVSEETALTDEFGIAGVRTGYTGTDIDVVNTTHYITSVFTAGPLAIASSATALNRLTGSIAPGLDALAQTTGNPELGAIETGGLLYDGGTAAGRRVQLPWGTDAFDINLLTADGQTLMRRAIEWGASTGSLAGPVAHWKLDETGGTTAVDSAGGNDGTLTNGPVWTPGKIDGGLEFDGVNDRVSAGTFDVSGSGLTLMGWFNADTIPTSDPRIISKASSTSEADAWWQLSTTDVGASRYLRMRIKAGGITTTFADSSTNLLPGQWYFAVGTYHAASGQMKLYLEGAEIASGTHAVGGPVDTDPTVPVAIGANGTAERFFDGILDDVRVYDRVLSTTEIAGLFTAGGGGGGGGGGSPTIVEVRVATGNDDAEERVSNSSMYLTSTDLELISDGATAQLVGMRFTGVAIPNGATISNAWIQFQVDETNSGATNVNIQGEASDSAAQFTTANSNISSRSRSAASVPWSPVPWTTVGEAGPNQRTPDISAVIQEIVSRPGWASGNDMVMIITGSGERTAESYNGSSTGAPLLHIEY